MHLIESHRHNKLLMGELYNPTQYLGLRGLQVSAVSQELFENVIGKNLEEFKGSGFMSYYYPSDDSLTSSDLGAPYCDKIGGGNGWGGIAELMENEKTRRNDIYRVPVTLLLPDYIQTTLVDKPNTPGPNFTVLLEDVYAGFKGNLREFSEYNGLLFLSDEQKQSIMDAIINQREQISLNFPVSYQKEGIINSLNTLLSGLQSNEIAIVSPPIIAGYQYQDSVLPGLLRNSRIGKEFEKRAKKGKSMPKLYSLLVRGDDILSGSQRDIIKNWIDTG
ncbi:MAG: hypothetical protein US52_C0005G0011, partial [candidate division WS6 bacterium GW2011_GWA2_37_6]